MDLNMASRDVFNGWPQDWGAPLINSTFHSTLAEGLKLLATPQRQLALVNLKGVDVLHM